MLGSAKPKPISVVPSKPGPATPGSVYNNLVFGKTSRDIGLINGVSDRDGFAALWQAVSAQPSKMQPAEGLPFSWIEQGVTYTSDCLAFEKNMVGTRALLLLAVLLCFNFFFVVDHL